jgi:hypothetical protein
MPAVLDRRKMDSNGNSKGIAIFTSPALATNLLSKVIH